MFSRRPSSYPRRRYRSRRRAFLKRNWKLLAATGLIFFLAPALAASLTLNGYLLGVLQASVAWLYVLATILIFHASTGAGTLFAGALGEDNTRDVLKRAKRKRLIWGWVDSIEVQSGDIDHLVVLRDGRLLMLDSKWRSGDLGRWRDSDVLSAQAASRRARNVMRHLKRPAEVEGAIVVWGSCQDDLPECGAAVDDVALIAGRHFVAWLKQRTPGPAIARSEAKGLIADLTTFRQTVVPRRTNATAPGAARRRAS